MTRRYTFLRYIVILLAVAMLGVVGAALACGPAASPPQQDATAPTMTTTPAGASSAATATPTPQPTDAPPTRNPKLGSVLNAVVIKREKQDTAQSGVSGQSAPTEQLISVSIDLIGEDVDQITRFLKDHGGSISMILLDPNGSYIEGEVPVTVLSRLSQQPGVLTVTAAGQTYPNLSDQLNDLLAEYEAGFLSAEEAAARAPQYDGQKISVHFQIQCAQLEGIKAFSSTNGNFLLPEQIDAACTNGTDTDHIYTAVPIPVLASLSSQPGVVHVWLIHGSKPMSMFLAPTITPGARIHGALPWRQAGYTGEAVRVGIIDYGFHKDRLPVTVKALCFTSPD